MTDNLEKGHSISAGDFLNEFADYQDYLAPRLDTYEQAIYLYILRHSRFVGRQDVTIGFKSARRRLAFGTGESGTPMSEGTAYKKVKSLQAKGFIEVISSERAGQRIRAKLPSEFVDLKPEPRQDEAFDIETLDYFNDPRGRRAILAREGWRCFYCFKTLTDEDHVIEHVRSRPEGDNSYRNLVAACRSCNNRKGATEAEDFLRTLYREQLISEAELTDRFDRLQDLRDGLLKPSIDDFGV